jgi:hypothetical protein
VPIIIRSLADSLGMLSDDHLPIEIDPSILMMLDIDVTDKANKCRIVQRYEHAWWNERKPRNLELADILDASSVRKCLEFHRNELALSDDRPIIHQSTPSSMPTNTAIQGSAGHPISQLAKQSCRQCTEYSEILSATLHDLLDTHRFSNTSMTSSETQWNLDMRRASTFYELHEAVVKKETAGTPSAAVLTRGPDAVRYIAERSKVELDRLRALPPTSYKWTWGEQLTEDEILGLGQSNNFSHHLPHSGYKVPLRSGPLEGQDSPIASLPTTPSVLDAVPDKFSAPPDNQLPIHSYFKHHNQLIYDPLGKSAADDAHHLAEHSASASEEINVADKWSSASEEKKMTDVADIWSSASEEKEIADVAEKWSSASEEKEMSDVAEKWPSASEETGVAGE